MRARAFECDARPASTWPSHFGEVGLRLEPLALGPRADLRAHPYAIPSRNGERGDLCVRFAVDRLEPAEREALTAVLTLQEPLAGAVAGLAQGKASDLRDLASASRSAAQAAAGALLAAHEAALRVPMDKIMGILNVTPDSFSDGGRFAGTEAAIEQGLKLLAEGAEILDVGGESTRPGAAPVSPEEERARVLPVIEGLVRATDAPISIDTTKATVARDALRAGASIVNDISAGLADPAMFDTVANAEAELVLMHMRGTPRTMQAAPHYDDVVGEVTSFLRGRASCAWKAGIPLSRIAIDPGIGFGKRLHDNLDLLRSLTELRSLGLPVVVGVSRKSFLGRLTGTELASERGLETAVATTHAALLGADVHRVHDAGATRRALQVATALRDRTEPREPSGQVLS